jgi:hypothetical protein
MSIFSWLFRRGAAKVVDKAVDKATTKKEEPAPAPEAAPAEGDQNTEPIEEEKIEISEEEKAAAKAEKKAAKKAAEAKANQEMMDQAMADMKDQQAAALAADPELVAPFEGITVENWAQAASSMVSNQEVESQAKALAKLGMDRALYERVNAEMTARMQRDTTGAMATIYGNAFAGAQNVDTGGEEPVSFEKYGEIAGAQAAWGEMGADVIANLKKFFDITAVDVSNYGSYWMAKFTADYTLMEKHSDLMDKYKAKYKSGGDLDDDLDI